MATVKRKIITIDEEKCNGCGDCITACAEGALKLVNGKAKLVKEQFCDGFGDCMGECPTGALKIVEREAEDFSFEATREHVLAEGGQEAVDNLMSAHHRHDEKQKLKIVQETQTAPAPSAAHGHHHGGGCPGSMMRTFNQQSPATVSAGSGGGPGHVIPSELSHWPVQIHLVRPDAPFFKNRELVVMSTCGPIACPDVHWRFIRGRSIVVGCPKLDDTESYSGKLAAILSETSIPKVQVVRMEVPCCGGLTQIVKTAAILTGRTDLQVEEVTLGLNGDLKGARLV